MGNLAEHDEAEASVADSARDLWERMLERCLDLRVVSISELETVLVAEPASDCPGCRARLEAHAVVLCRRSASQTPKDPYELVFPVTRVPAQKSAAAVAAALRRRQRGPSQEEREARIRQAVAELRGLPHEARLAQIQLRHYHFRGARAARAFLAEARACLPANPAESARFAEYADLAAGLDRPGLGEDFAELTALSFQADLYRANALRCAGELGAAEAGFDQATAGAGHLGVQDLRFWAESKFLRASLLRAQRRFAEALKESKLAAVIFRFLGEKELEIQSRLKVSTIHEQHGEFRSALATIREALPAATTSGNAALELAVRHAEVIYLVRLGDAATARSHFEPLSSLYTHYPHYQSLRQWARGLIAAGLCEPQEAETAFHRARDGFLAARNAYDAALVTLDWTLLLLNQGRAEDVLPLALSMGQSFEALGVARETLASWAIFQAAAERRELTRAVAESMVRTLGEERAGAKPGR